MGTHSRIRDVIGIVMGLREPYDSEVRTDDNQGRSHIKGLFSAIAGPLASIEPSNDRYVGLYMQFIHKLC